MAWTLPVVIFGHHSGPPSVASPSTRHADRSSVCFRCVWPASVSSLGGQSSGESCAIRAAHLRSHRTRAAAAARAHFARFSGQLEPARRALVAQLISDDTQRAQLVVARGRTLGPLRLELVRSHFGWRRRQPKSIDLTAGADQLRPAGAGGEPLWRVDGRRRH
jgi:hypothetical protein